MNLSFLLDSVAEMLPDREAVWEPGGTLTYAELRARSRAWGGLVQARSGGRPVLQVGTATAGFVALLYGTAEAGRLFVPANYRLKPPEMAHVVATVGPGLIVCDERYRGLVEGALRETGVACEVLPSDLVPPPPERFEPDEMGEGPAVGLFTSGTSAAPKLALLSHSNLSDYVLNTVEAGSALESETVLISTPPYHVAAVANVLSNTFRGRRMALLGQFDPVAWLETVRATRG